MKILIGLTYYSPYVSGLTRYVERVAGALKEDVQILTNKHDPSLPNSENLGGVIINRADPILKIGKGFLSVDYLVKCWKLTRWSDVVWINLPGIEGVWLAVCAKIMHKKIIATYHCDLILPKTNASKIVEIVVDVCNWFVLIMSKIIVAYTKDYVNHSRILPKFKKKIVYIYPPIPIPKTNKEWWKKMKALVGGKGITVGIAARLATEKGFEYLLEAMKMLEQNVRLIVAGPVSSIGEERYKEKILKMAFNLGERVIWLGAVPEKAMGSFYKMLDVFVLPSVNSTESFGMVQVEAMKMGVPVVATDLPGVREAIRVTGMGEIVPVRDSNKIAEAIERALKNRYKLGKKTRLVNNIFDLNKTVDSYKIVFYG